jgi:hypothetical protein
LIFYSFFAALSIPAGYVAVLLRVQSIIDFFYLFFFRAGALVSRGFRSSAPARAEYS